MRRVPRTSFAVLASLIFAVTAFSVTDIAPSFGPFHAGPGTAEANVTVVSLTHSPETVNTTTVVTYKCIVNGPAFVVRLVLRRPDQATDLWVDMVKTDAVTYEYTDGPYNSPGHTVRYRVEVFDGNNITQYPADGTFIIVPIAEPPTPDDHKGGTTNMNVIYLLLGAIVLFMVLFGAIAALISAKSRQRDEKKYAAMIQRDKDALLPPSANIVEVPGSKRAQKKHDYMEGKKAKSDRPSDRDLYAADGADAIYEDEVDDYYGGYGEGGEGYGEGQGDGYGYGPGGEGGGGGYGAGAAGGEGYYDDGYGDYPADDGYDYPEQRYAPEGAKGDSSKDYGEWYDQRSYYQPQQPQQQQQRAQPRPQQPQQQRAQPRPQQPQQQRAQPRPQQPQQQRPPQQPQKAQPKPQAPQQQKRPAQQQPQQPQKAQVKPQAQQKPSSPQQQQKRPPAPQTQPSQPQKGQRRRQME